MQLETMGFKVRVCYSAEELLDSPIPTGDICLLADVYLPGMNGIELCKQLTVRGSGLPTILMSGRDDERTVRLMRSVKPVASLFKPFDKVSLMRAIKKALRRSSKRFP